MKVEGQEHGYVRPHRPAHAPEEFALAVVVDLRRHGAVQFQEHCVGAFSAKALDDAAGHALKGVVRHAPARHGAGPCEREHSVAGRLRRFHEVGDGEVEAAEGREHGLALRRPRPRTRLGEFVPPGWPLHEGVRLVHEAAYGNAEGHARVVLY